MKSILVTGGAGYIGSHACKALAKAGFLPVVYDNLSTGHKEAVQWGPLVISDLLDTQKLIETLRLYKPVGVLHFAACALVVESMHDPAKYYQNNVQGTLSLLEAMRQTSVSALVFSSSCATYGNPQTIPIEEQHLQAPINPYGRTKLIGEQMIGDFATAYGLKTAILRYFNVAGADAEGKIGEKHDPETHLIPSILQTLLKIKPEIVVYGTDFPTADGSAIRDYIHVEDLVEAHLLALEHILQTGKNLTLNLGTGKGYSVLEIIRAVEKICHQPVNVRFEKKRPGEPAALTALGQRATELLGWKPKRSSLENLIASAWTWQQK